MALIATPERTTLVRMLRVMFPHPQFPDGPYERVAVAVAGGDARTQAQVCQGLTDLDRLRDKPFADLDDTAATDVLRAIESTAFFAAVRSVALVKLYDDHEVWDLLGYEGPSFDKGGYVHRGFADLDWLPDPAIEYPAEDDQEVTA